MLKFIALSGTTSVTENLYIYEYKDEMMIVDCGVGFPELEMYGVDLVIPDFSYIKKNKHKLKGILVSQGHEDHQGALPFLLKEVKAPIYAPKLTAAFIKDKLDDYQVGGVQVNVFNPSSDVLTIGPFKVTPFNVPHSIPDTLGFAIDTPEGRVMHIAEYKFDPNPVIGKPFDSAKVASLSRNGLLFLATDSLGSNKKGSTPGERQIEGNLFDIMKQAENNIFFTTISSSISRIQQVINIAKKLDRKVAFVGYSIKRKSEIAQELGYLKYSKNTVVYLKKAINMPKNSVLYIIAGCYGQVGSSLFRLATGDHSRVSAEAGDMVVFSADPAPPYTKESEDFVIDNFIDMGVDVHYYDLKEELYVSGHASQDDIVKLSKLIKPKYYIPTGGTIRFMHSFKKLMADNLGIDRSRVLDLKPGESVVFENNKARRGEKIPVKHVLVDGLGIGDVGRVVLEDRKTLSQHGVAIAIIQLDSARKRLTADPEIISRGFVFEKEEKKFLKNSGKALREKLEKRGRVDFRSAKYITVDFLADVFYKETGRRPMILPVVVRT